MDVILEVFVLNWCLILHIPIWFHIIQGLLNTLHSFRIIYIIMIIDQVFLKTLLIVSFIIIFFFQSMNRVHSQCIEHIRLLSFLFLFIIHLLNILNVTVVIFCFRVALVSVSQFFRLCWCSFIAKAFHSVKVFIHHAIDKLLDAACSVDLWQHWISLLLYSSILFSK